MKLTLAAGSIVTKSDESSVYSTVVSIATVIAALSGALWPIGLGLTVLHGGRGGEPGWRVLLDHPWGAVMGLSVTTGFFVSAWLLERNRWIGAIFPAAWYLSGILNTYVGTGRHLSLSAVTLPIELVITLLALRDLWPLRAARSHAQP